MPRSEIESLLRARVAALLAGDADRLAATLHPQYRYVDSLGRSLDRLSYVQSRRSGEVRLTRHDLSDIEFVEIGSGEAVLVTCVSEDAGTFRGGNFQSRYRAMHLVVRGESGWSFVFGQSTAMAIAGPPHDDE